jgi:hypothetical protein
VVTEWDDDAQTRVVDSSAFAGALAGAFSSAVTEPAPAPIGMAADEWYVGINGVPVGPVKLTELRSKAASGAITQASLVWREGFEQWQPLSTYPELLAIVEESVSSVRASANPLVAPAAPAPVVGTALVDPFAAQPSAPIATAPVTGPAVVSDRLDLELAGLSPRRGTSPAAWIAVVVALLFGLTIGFVVFSRQTPAEPIVKYVEVPAKSEPQPKAGTEPPPPGPEQVEESTVAAAPGPGRAGGAKAEAPKKEASGKPIEGLKGLAGLQGSGPQGGPSGSDPRPASAGQPLDSESVQRTVSRYTSSVKRSCWQPALDTRDKDAPTSARVNVAITVSASGSVQNVETSGDPRGYRGLATCIGSRVRGWQFPASSGTTTVNVPFVFAAQ